MKDPTVCKYKAIAIEQALQTVNRKTKMTNEMMSDLYVTPSPSISFTVTISMFVQTNETQTTQSLREDLITESMDNSLRKRQRILTY